MVDLVDVVLVNAGPKPTDVVKAIRDVTCDEPLVRAMDLREALRRVKTAPCVVAPNLPRDAGQRIKTSLEHAGASVELKPS